MEPFDSFKYLFEYHFRLFQAAIGTRRLRFTGWNVGVAGYSFAGVKARISQDYIVMRFVRNALWCPFTPKLVKNECDKVRATCPWSSASRCGLSAAGFGATQWAEATAAPGPNAWADWMLQPKQSFSYHVTWFQTLMRHDFKLFVSTCDSNTCEKKPLKPLCAMIRRKRDSSRTRFERNP